MRKVNHITFQLRKAFSRVSDKTHKLKFENTHRIYPENICQHCGYEMDEEEAESAVDCGCPVCRCLLDWEESEYPRFAKVINY